MKKVVVPLLIGFAAAFITGFALQALFTSTGVKDPPNMWWVGALVGVFAAYIAGNLAGNRRVAKADDAERADALSFAAPVGMARIYVYREGFFGMAAGMNVTVDGLLTAQLKSPRFASFVAPPGPHEIRAAFGALAGAQNKVAVETVTLVAGELAVFKVDIGMGAIQNTLRLVRETPSEALRAKFRRWTMVATEGGTFD